MLEIKHLTKHYQETVLDDVSLTLPTKGLVVIVGDSGCGKTTLLNIIGGLDQEYLGEVLFEGVDIKEIPQYRHYIGYMFQGFHLIPWLKAYQNVTLPQYFREIHPLHYIKEQLEHFALFSLRKKKISQLSGGQQQRIALLRAIVNPVRLLLCDEPTGSLDEQAAKEVFSLLKSQAKTRLVIVVTHDYQLAKEYHDILITMQDGKVMLDITSDCRQVQYLPELQVPAKYRTIHLALKQGLSKWKRNVKICSGIALAILCILLTFTLSRGLQKQITQQLHQILPVSSITMVSKDKKSISEEVARTLLQQDSVQFAYIECDEYEFMGIGNHENYEEKEVLYINDTTKPMNSSQSLAMGRLPNQATEIVLSNSTAKHYSKGKKIEELLNQEVYGWFLHDFRVEKVSLKIVGISKENTTLDTIYYQAFANVDMIKTLQSDANTNGSVVILQVSNQYSSEQAIQELQNQYPAYQFTVSSAGMEKQIETILSQAQMVLLCFSILAIISSCFLIGEVLFLSIVERIKEIGIFKCLGATNMNIKMMTLVEAIAIVTVAYIFAYQMFLQLLTMINEIIKSSGLMEGGAGDFIVIDYTLLVIVYIGALLLALLASFFPAVYASKIDVIKALKQ